MGLWDVWRRPSWFTDWYGRVPLSGAWDPTLYKWLDKEQLCALTLFWLWTQQDQLLRAPAALTYRPWWTLNCELKQTLSPLSGFCQWLSQQQEANPDIIFKVTEASDPKHPQPHANVTEEDGGHSSAWGTHFAVHVLSKAWLDTVIKADGKKNYRISPNRKITLLLAPEQT